MVPFKIHGPFKVFYCQSPILYLLVCSGRLTDSIINDNIAWISMLLNEDTQLTLSELAMGMSLHCQPSSTRTIVHNVIRCQKLSAWLVPDLLMEEHKANPIAARLAFLEYANAWGPSWQRYEDKTWVHYYPWTKTTEQAAVHARTGVSQKGQTQTFSQEGAGYSVLGLDWASVNSIHAQGTTFNSNTYCTILKELKWAIGWKCPDLLPENALFLHVNAHPHTAAQTQEHLVKFCWTILTHPPYSPDLAPSNFHLFPGLKRALGSY